MLFLFPPTLFREKTFLLALPPIDPPYLSRVATWFLPHPPILVSSLFFWHFIFSASHTSFFYVSCGRITCFGPRFLAVPNYSFRSGGFDFFFPPRYVSVTTVLFFFSFPCVPPSGHFSWLFFLDLFSFHASEALCCRATTLSF